ncbi:diaminopimelate decarboxylase [Alicyclobacillus tolerans]|nr:diaminopimelate decarboxylase [Alicyclobacillus montanus]
MSDNALLLDERLREGQWVGDNGHLWIGQCDAVELANTYGTPLIVYDETQIRTNIRRYLDALKKTELNYRLTYASKAFCSKAMCHVAYSEGCFIDVVSAGEMMTALAAGVPASYLHFHGNNKSLDELRLALKQEVGLIIVDNKDELLALSRLAEEANGQVDIQLRIAPGVEAHTHEYISTGQQDSKFGFDWQSDQAIEALRLAATLPGIRVTGLHAHIGSQIFDASGFHDAVERMAELYKEGLLLGHSLQVLNMGGGLGIRYTSEDTPQPLEKMILGLAEAIKRIFTQFDIPFPALELEPGRSIVGNAGTTLYRAGWRKQVDGVRNYVAIDGGMTDNPRLALYGAKYEAMLANRASEAADTLWSIAGKCCESGDMIAWDVPLPNPEPGDLIAIFATGAYNYSMASHYNRLPKPAVVFVREGQARLVARRETWEDLIRNDVSL